MSQLLQLATLKARLQIKQTDTTDDAILTTAIKSISARFKNDCNRQFEYQAAAQFEFRAEVRDIVVDRPPILSVATFEIKQSEALGWQVLTGTDIPDFLINPERNIVELLEATGFRGQLGRITFAGGFILPGCMAVAGVPALPDDLEQACVEQCAYWYQRKSQLGLVSISGDGGSISQFRSLDLLPNVAAIISKYERLML